MKLVGKERVDYVKKDGVRVLAHNLYFTSDVDATVDGLKTESLYITDAQVPKGLEFKLGLEMEVIRDGKGWFQRMIILN